MAKINEQSSAAQLIRGLEAENRNFKRVCLVVGFENHSEFVFGKDSLNLRKLEYFVKSGGKPVGLIGFHWEDRLVKIYTRPFTEFGDKALAENILYRAVLGAYRAVKKSGVVRPRTRIQRETGWRYADTKRKEKMALTAETGCFYCCRPLGLRAEIHIRAEIRHNYENGGTRDSQENFHLFCFSKFEDEGGRPSSPNIFYEVMDSEKIHPNDY